MESKPRGLPTKILRLMVRKSPCGEGGTIFGSTLFWRYFLERSKFKVIGGLRQIGLRRIGTMMMMMMMMMKKKKKKKNKKKNNKKNILESWTHQYQSQSTNILRYITSIEFNRLRYQPVHNEFGGSAGSALPMVHDGAIYSWTLPKLFCSAPAAGP